MAYVTRDRAQLILVSGLMIAVTMLILVLLLNTVIYTENVATRGIDSDVGEAAEVQVVIDREVEAILAAHDPVDSRDALNNTVGDGIEILLSQQANVSIERGHAVAAEARITPGVFFEANEEDTNDREIDNVERFRTFNLTIDGTELEGESIDLVTGDWTLTADVTEDTIDFENSTGESICTVDVAEEPIDLFVDCEDVFDEDGVPSEVSGEYDLTFEGNESIEYNVTVSGESLETEADGAKWYADLVTVDYRYLSPDVRYETVRVISGVIPS